MAAAVLANAAVRVTFRVGDEDANRLAEGLSSFTARDLQNLTVGEAVCRIDRAEWDFNLRTVLHEPVSDDVAQARRAEITARSRERYGVPAGAAEASAPSVADTPYTADVNPLAGPARSLKPPTPVRATLSPTGAPARPLADPRPPPGPMLPGRGGRQHKYLQELVKRWAESKGYRATTEDVILDGTGSVDVALEREDRKIACEISITTPPDHEVQNVAKCLAAGFQEVFVIVVEKNTAKRLREAVLGSLTPTQLDCVRVVSPDEFFTAVETREQPAVKTGTVRGYRVSVSSGSAAGDREARERAIVNTVLGALRRPKR